MKKVISVLCLLAVLATGALAQEQQRGRQGRGGEGWRERVRAEKVAFLTEQIDFSIVLFF